MRTEEAVTPSLTTGQVLALTRRLCLVYPVIYVAFGLFYFYRLMRTGRPSTAMRGEQ